MKFLTAILLLFLHGAPRILCILFAVIIGLIARLGYNDTPHIGFWDTLMVLLSHLAPALFVIVILIFSWRWAWIGGISYILSGIAIGLIWGWDSNLPFFPFAFLIGLLFLISWFLRKNIKKAQLLYRGE